jgi:antitoxin ParD1/3/4
MQHAAQCRILPGVLHGKISRFSVDSAILCELITQEDKHMPRTTSITIGEHLDRFINDMIESGRYGSTSEVIRSALRLLEEQELRNNALRDALEEGIRSGESDLTLQDIAARKKRHLNV